MKVKCFKSIFLHENTYLASFWHSIDYTFDAAPHHLLNLSWAANVFLGILLKYLSVIARMVTGR